MRRLAVLTVCLLLVLSGCNAAPSGENDGTTTTVETHTDPTTVPPTDETATTGSATTDAMGTDSDRALPPGLTPSGVTDSAALAVAHEEALAGRSYTYDREVAVVAANGTDLGGWSQHTQVGADRLRFNHTQTGEGVSVAGITIDDSRVYTNGSVTFWNASAFSDGYRRAPGRGFAANTFSSEQLLADTLNASHSSVETVEREGQTWYRVRAEQAPETLTHEAPNGTVAVNATNATTVALVSPAGLVRTVTYEFDFERNGVSGHRTMTVEYTAIGETEVETPAWVADAKATTRSNQTRLALADRLAPGLNESGVTDAWALADAHASVLRNTSYTVTSNLTARAPDETLRARLNATRRVERDPSRTYGRSLVGGENPRAVGLAGFDLEVWSTENGTWYAVEKSNGTDYRKVSQELEPTFGERTDHDRLAVLFGALATTVSATETRNGTTLYRVESTDVSDADVLAGELRADSVRNVSMTALVSERGLVREYHLEYVATLAGNTSRVERTVRFTALGGTSVERPAWYDDATANATADDPS